MKLYILPNHHFIQYIVFLKSIDSLWDIDNYLRGWYNDYFIITTENTIYIVWMNEAPDFDFDDVIDGRVGGRERFSWLWYILRYLVIFAWFLFIYFRYILKEKWKMLNFRGALKELDRWGRKLVVAPIVLSLTVSHVIILLSILLHQPFHLQVW